VDSLHGRVAVCTGSGRPGGLGEAILDRLAREGCDVVVTDLGQPAEGLSADRIGTSEDMDRVAAAVSEHGTRVLAIPCDVRDADQVDTLVSRTVKELGRVDILINNAAIGFVMEPLGELALADWQRVLDVNLTGAFICTRRVATDMRRAGGGRVINIASQAAKSGFPHMAPYVASKHGLIGLTRTAAIDLAADNITVNAVCPNHVTTGLGREQNEYFSRLRGQSVEDYRAGIRQRIPLGRVGMPADTAAVVAFLASDDAAYITGEAINVSGGEEMH